jgi:hypothetical protein
VLQVLADQLVVGYQPDLARPAPPPQPTRAAGAAPGIVGLMLDEKLAPSAGQTVDLAAGQLFQLCRCGATGLSTELVQSV